MVTADELLVRVLLTGYSKLLRPALFTSNMGDPEEIHRQMIKLLGQLPDRILQAVSDVLGKQSNPVTIAGVYFPGRVGVAAGLDKDADAIRAWGPLGFGFAELGTVTARAQPGNRPPRLFRLPHSRAVINRMGFNNCGAEAMAAHLQQAGVRRGNQWLGIPFGISIGKTKVTALGEAVADYLASFDAVAPFADYLAINVSSPNTPGLRSLQDRSELQKLLRALIDRARQRHPDKPIPLFVKVAPDMTTRQLGEIISVCEDEGAAGLIATNTTTSRMHLHPCELHLANQAGGLSGAPLTRRALQTVEFIVGHTDLPVMGAGGIMTPRDAQHMFDAGAQLVQIYTGFIYAGPALVLGINTLTEPQRAQL